MCILSILTKIDTNSRKPYLLPLWALNVRVGENSPRICPTMFSVTKTETNFLPLCTAIVSPTKSGITVLCLDHVLITSLFELARTFSTFLSKEGCTNGPFLANGRNAAPTTGNVK